MPESSPDKKIVVGCGEWGFREMPMERHFQIAQSFGFRYLEFGIGGAKPGRLSESPASGEIDQLLELCEEYQIQTPFCCLENDFTLGDPVRHRQMVDKVLRQMVTARECRATHVRLFAGFTPLAAMTEIQWDGLLDALHECQNLADKLGLEIAIETHGAIGHGPAGEAIHLPTVTTDQQGLNRLLHHMPQRTGINYDPGNIKAAEGNSENLHLHLLNHRVNYCHLKDWKRQGQGWVACAVGDDDLDYGSLIRRMHFNGVYLIEYEPLHDPEDGIRRSLHSLKSAGLGIAMDF